MKKIVTIGFLSLFLLGNFSVYGKAQDDEEDEEDKIEYEFYEGPPFSHWAVGINVGTYGYGFEVNTHLLPNIKLRTGFNFYWQTFDALTLKIVDYYYQHGTSQDILKANATLTPDVQFINGKILFDILPFSTQMLAFTTGVYIGKNNIILKGNVYDEKGNPITSAMEFGNNGIIVRPNQNGYVDATFRMGNIVKPYLGLTFGRAIPRNKFGFKVELGILYQGKIELESNSIKKSKNENALNAGIGKLELPFNENWLRVWPMVQMQFTYKIK